ncbi:unnamed protein product [Chrysoparadoxa australica]
MSGLLLSQGGIRAARRLTGASQTPLSHVCHQQQARTLRLWDEPIAWMKARKEKKDAVDFKEQIQVMLKADKDYNLNDLKELHGKAARSWVAKIPGMSSLSQEVKSSKQLVQVIDSFTEEERKNPSKITKGDKERVAASTQLKLEEVEAVLTAFRQVTATSKWLQSRKERGLRIPRNQVGLHHLAVMLQTASPSNLALPVLQPVQSPTSLICLNPCLFLCFLLLFFFFAAVCYSIK